MAEKCLKKCSTFLVTREMLSKTSLRFHLRLIRMVKINKADGSSYWYVYEEEATHVQRW